MYVCMHKYVYIYMYVNMCIYKNIYVYVYISICFFDDDLRFSTSNNDTK